MSHPIINPIMVNTEAITLAVMERCAGDNPPDIQRTGLDPGADTIPTTWFNWRNNSVGFALDDDELVVFEMTTKHLLLAHESSVEALMAAVDAAIAKNPPK